MQFWGDYNGQQTQREGAELASALTESVTFNKDVKNNTHCSKRVRELPKKHWNTNVKQHTQKTQSKRDLSRVVKAKVLKLLMTQLNCHRTATHKPEHILYQKSGLKIK